MNYRIRTIPKFEKQAKKLSKKYPSFKSDFIKLVSILKVNPEYGIYLGNDCYKIRLAITSKGKGKSSGARVITHFAILEETLFLLSIYEKSAKESITDNELQELINEIP